MPQLQPIGQMRQSIKSAHKLIGTLLDQPFCFRSEMGLRWWRYVSIRNQTKGYFWSSSQLRICLAIRKQSRRSRQHASVLLKALCRKRCCKLLCQERLDLGLVPKGGLDPLTALPFIFRVFLAFLLFDQPHSFMH